MKAVPFISRHLKFSQTLSVVGVALSFFIIIVAVSIAAGFRSEIRRGLSELGGDIQVGCYPQGEFSEEASISLSEPWIDSLRALPGVQKVVPVAYRKGIACNNDDIQGVIVKGVPCEVDSVSLGVSIPRKLSQLLRLEPSDRMLTYFIGDKVQARNFTVTGIYDAMTDSQDKLVVLADIKDLQRLNGWQDDQVSCLEVIAEENMRDALSLRKLSTDVMVCSQMMATSVYDRYPALFDWLNLIDTNVTAILLLMILVGAFNMISGLLIMLFRNTSTIGALKAFGMTDRAVSRVFLRAGAKVIGVGMLIGNGAALLFALLQNTFHLIKLDSASYFLSEVPVYVDVPQILAYDIIAFAAIELLLLLPCLFISKVDPAQTLSQR